MGFEEREGGGKNVCGFTNSSSRLSRNRWGKPRRTSFRCTALGVVVVLVVDFVVSECGFVAFVNLPRPPLSLSQSLHIFIFISASVHCPNQNKSARVRTICGVGLFLKTVVRTPARNIVPFNAALNKSAHNCVSCNSCASSFRRICKFHIRIGGIGNFSHTLGRWKLLPCI